MRGGDRTAAGWCFGRLRGTPSDLVGQRGPRSPDLTLETASPEGCRDATDDADRQGCACSTAVTRRPHPRRSRGDREPARAGAPGACRAPVQRRRRTRPSGRSAVGTRLPRARWDEALSPSGGARRQALVTEHMGEGPEPSGHRLESLPPSNPRRYRADPACHATCSGSGRAAPRAAHPRTAPSRAVAPPGRSTRAGGSVRSRGRAPPRARAPRLVTTASKRSSGRGGRGGPRSRRRCGHRSGPSSSQS